jgi:starvation-inducible DNA-binding protein
MNTIVEHDTLSADIGISEASRQQIATLLNQLVADESVLYLKTKNYHWNVEGEDFWELHKFFDEQADSIGDFIDDTAERVRSLGHYAVASMKDYLQLTRLLETPHELTGQGMLRQLLSDHETLIRVIRNAITPVAEQYRDLGTADYLTGLMEKHEKMAWMLRAYVKKSRT